MTDVQRLSDVLAEELEGKGAVSASSLTLVTGVRQVRHRSRQSMAQEPA